MIDAVCGSCAGWSRMKSRRKGSRRRDEPILMEERRHGYFPKVFMWRGERYYVDAVKRCWAVSRRGRDGRVERHVFEVCCGDQVFELYQDIRFNTWHLRRQVV